MNTLPRGITGFWIAGQSGIPQVAYSLIKKIVTRLYSSNTFQKIVITEPKIDTNFYIISFTDKNDDYKIGVNATYPIYCGIKSMSNWETVAFCDLPDYITTLIPEEFSELKTEFLNTPLQSRHTTALNKAELKQIKHWKTKNIGNVIFNKYD